MRVFAILIGICVLNFFGGSTVVDSALVPSRRVLIQHFFRNLGKPVKCCRAVCEMQGGTGKETPVKRSRNTCCKVSLNSRNVFEKAIEIVVNVIVEEHMEFG